MSGLTIPLKTIEAQQKAANPRASAWVSANAGAGKTKVLTDRVLRLLLAGSLPGRILCLTFTKAAAANMSIRVFERLGRWVTLTDEELEQELQKLQGRAPSREDMRIARRLFARAIETPGGLKIETLHAFCERLLHLVPFEANVPARFSVLDENLANEMIDRTIDETLSAILAGQMPELETAWHIVSAQTGGDMLRALIGSALRERELASPAGLKARLVLLAQALRVDPQACPDDLRATILAGGLEPDHLAQMAEVLGRSDKATDQSRSADIRAVLVASDEERFERYSTIFFTATGNPRSDRAFVTKGIPDDIRQTLFDERDRLAEAKDGLLAAEAYQRTAALYRLASAIKQRIEMEKAEKGQLDFDDLVHKTLDVLSRDAAAWVLYKLDRGVDHVLVDEAQDTNPDQWEILRAITAEFASGLGIERNSTRTVFAVGDPKQSIYGFQGAAPEQFELSRKAWEKNSRDVSLPFENVSLTLSFRSVPAVLSAVDATFAPEENNSGLSFGETGKARQTIHESARLSMPGTVELWPVERPEPEPEPDAWGVPLDVPEAFAPPVKVARRIARTVARWISSGDDNGRAWRAGDILVLVRKRGAAFEAVIRALKESNVPVAGQDRIEIGAHIAVLDLIAAGRAALLPQDDLTLATVLKSPLVGLSEDDLFTLAADRIEGEPLVVAIERHAAAGHGIAATVRATLAEWRALARDLGPFGFYATLLGPLQGRARLVARLGSEAGDAIDAFLTFARNAEMMEALPLLSFLVRFERASYSVKRDFEAARDEVRVMTVHGAKGLEAPVTIVIDGCDVHGRDPALVPVASKGQTIPVWTTKTADCSITGAARADLRAKAIEEHHRLLYVAMTRAGDRLLIAPFMNSANGEVPPEAWNAMVRRGLEGKPDDSRLSNRKEEFGDVLMWREGDAGKAPSVPEARATTAPESAHDWLKRDVVSEPEPLPPLRPSTALSAAQQPVRDRVRTRPGSAKARLRGTLAHALIERLPLLDPATRDAQAHAYLALRAPTWSETEHRALLADVTRLLGAAALAPLFAEGARAEVTIAGTVRIPGRDIKVSGQIDRFAVHEGTVLIADFKTSRPPVGDHLTPQSYITQVALYAALLAELYPDHRVRPFIVWTAGPLMREIGPAECAAALADIKNDHLG